MAGKGHELTVDEIREEFLAMVRSYIHYWAKEDKAPSVQEKLEGLAFSILVILDRGAGMHPGMCLVADPHPEDKEYRKENGKNWYPPIPPKVRSQLKDIGGGLHELLRRKKHA